MRSHADSLDVVQRQLLSLCNDRIPYFRFICAAGNCCFSGSIKQLYKMCSISRTINRVVAAIVDLHRTGFFSIQQIAIRKRYISRNIDCQIIICNDAVLTCIVSCL